MALTADLRRKIDQIRDYLYGGGYPDPISNAEQLAFFFFFYLSEHWDRESAARARLARREHESLFTGAWMLKNPLNAPAPEENTVPAERLRWSAWARVFSGEPLVRFVRDEIFAFYAQAASRSAVNFMDGARLVIDEPTVLAQVLNLVDELRLDQADADTKGDLFEYVLGQIKQAGELGQFRTPRHIIRAIVRMLDPQIGETVYDPAAGTAGFLVAAYDHIRLHNSSEHATEELLLDGKPMRRGHGDKLSAAKWDILGKRTFYGNDVDLKMVHLATMNLTLRGLPDVFIRRRNVLTSALDAQQKAELGLPDEGYNVILANPPFSGRVDRDRLTDDVKIGSTRATEILFLKYMLDSLKAGGRCGVIVPEGVLFGSTKAHREIRRMLIENNRVEAVLSLPAGVFQPYSGVKTSVLLFTNGGTTERVLFLWADNDGYKLDARHDTPIEADDLPGLVEVFRTRAERWQEWQERMTPSPIEGEGGSGREKIDWPRKWWFATRDELAANDYNLSAGRYRPVSHALTEHCDPLEILVELRAMEAEIVREMEALEVKLRQPVI